MMNKEEYKQQFKSLWDAFMNEEDPIKENKIQRELQHLCDDYAEEKGITQLSAYTELMVESA